MRPLFLVALLAALASCKTTEPKPEPSPVAPVAAASPAAAPKPPEAPKVHLPDGAAPKRYELSLRVIPGEPTFTGEVSIELALEHPHDFLWLNARDLEPTFAEFTIGTTKLAAKAEAVGEHWLLVRPASTLPAGPATLVLRWRGELSAKNSSGLFQVKEGDEPYAVTQFEPIDARRAFPCFDEPSFKVPWRLTLHVKKEHLAFHNTPIEAETDEADGMKAVRFAETLPLPSYLVAFAVGPFETVDAGTWGRKKTKVRIVTPRGKGAEAKYAAENTGPILEQLERWFDMPYPYEKLDQLAMPVGFGAMEHPGLVTWGYRLMLVKPELDTPGHQRTFASVCAHELAHMWFGDLVTMAWWDDIWLNEAFATWMENKIIDGWKPDWALGVDRVLERGGALNADQLISARRIRQPIESFDDIQNAFDGITYGKGAAVIGMFEAWVGPELFQRGVREHLKAHAWGNATAAQFLASISREANRDVATPFATFLDQGGAPRVSLEPSCKPNEAPTLELTQRRALPVGSKGDARQVWQVPVCVRYSVAGKESRACTLLTTAQTTWTLEAKGCPDWVMPNDGMRGYYRASSKAGLLPLLQRAEKQLTVEEKLGLLDDVGAVVDSGDVDVEVALGAIPAALRSDDRHLVAAAQRLATQLADDVLPEPLRAKYETFIRTTFGPRALKLGLTVGPKEPEDQRLSRGSLVWLVAVQGREPTLRAKALTLAKKWLGDRKAIHPDLIGTVLSIAADTGDAELHRALVAAVAKEKDRADRGRMLQALGSFRDPAIVASHLALALDEKLDAREGMSVVFGASWDYRTRPVVFDFLEKNWDALLARLPEDAGANFAWFAGGVCDEATKERAVKLLGARVPKFLGGQRNLDQALENVDLCIAWRARQRPSAQRFIEAWKPSVGAKPAR
ncbi:MAG: M1 family metallopeptidase [Myxococcota bacterium]